MSETRSERIVRLFPLVRVLARRVRVVVPGAEFDELIGDGAVGLIRAVDTFDETRGASLERYVRQVVTGAMLNGLRKRDPVSERARRTLREAERQTFALAQERGELPAVGEMEQRLPGLRKARLALLEHMPLSLEVPFPPGTRALDRGCDPADAVVEETTRVALAAAVAELPPREALVIDLHYRHAIPLRSIGRSLAVSSQRASQLHLAALERLRKTVHS